MNQIKRDSLETLRERVQMKLKIQLERTTTSPLNPNVTIQEIQYRCPCKISKVIYVAVIENQETTIEEEILCSYCASIYEIVAGTRAQEVSKRSDSSIEPHLFPKRRKNGLKLRGVTQKNQD